MSTALAHPTPEPGPPTAEGRPLLRGWIHLVAFVVTVAAAPFVVVRAPTAGATAALAIYMTSIAALFGVSASFHRVRWSPAARRRMRRADHATIFIAIAGTNTAVAGLALRGWAQILILALVWGGAAVGIAVRQLWLDAPKWAVAVPYVLVGWCAMVVLPQLLHALGGAGFGLLAAGGGFYTAGAIVYSLRKPDPVPGVFGYHEVFHACTVVGAALHFVVVVVYALPRFAGMTYSIVARDADSGQLGVAVQTCWFAVGAIVPWARAGVGAVATQAMVEVSYGPKCLEALAAGAGARQALDEARAADEGSAIRQVAVVDSAGGVSAHTGDLCIAYAGHHQGGQYSVQANMMASPDVWPAMAEAYESAAGSFAERLLTTLRAAENAGGDARGRMSAAVLVVDGQRRPHHWEGVLVDVRVDHHDQPLDQLAHLLRAADAFDHCDRAEQALFARDPAGALDQVDLALGRLPGDENARFLRALALLASDRPEAGARELRALVATRPSWAVVVRSFAHSGQLTLPDGVDLDEVAPSGPRC